MGVCGLDARSNEADLQEAENTNTPNELPGAKGKILCLHAYAQEALETDNQAYPELAVPVGEAHL